MKKCLYCGEKSGFFVRVCGDCKKLLARVEELRGKVSYGQFLDGLQVTAEMTTELMNIMGMSGRQSPQEVKRIRHLVDKDSQ